MNKKTWETKVTEYFEDFSIYLNVEVSKDYNPQEIYKDLEEFKQYLIAKYIKVKVEPKLTFIDWLKLKLKV